MDAVIQKEEAEAGVSNQNNAGGAGGAGGEEIDPEEEQMRLVLEMSKNEVSEADKMAQEEEEMIRQVIEASMREEEERLK